MSHYYTNDLINDENIEPDIGNMFDTENTGMRLVSLEGCYASSTQTFIYLNRLVYERYIYVRHMMMMMMKRKKKN